MESAGRKDRLVPYSEELVTKLLALIRRDGGVEIVEAFLKEVAVLRGRMQIAQGEQRQALIREGAERRTAFLDRVFEELAESENKPA